MTPPSLAADRASAHRRAILLVLAASATFGLAAAFAKALGGAVPLPEVILFRNVFALLALLPLALRQGGWALLRTKNPWGHVGRTLAGLLGMAATFYGYVHLPLAMVTALGFTMPFFLALLAVPLLGERVGWRRGIAVMIGFCGVLVMVRPGGGVAAGSGPAIAFVLLGALGWALSMISIRRMGEAGEAGVTIVLWFAIGSAALAGIAAIPGWVWPAPLHWPLLVGIGLVSAVAQLLMTAAYRRGETTLLAPFEYSGIIWTTALGALLWHEFPDAWHFAGMAIVIGAGLMLWRQETREKERSRRE